MTVNLLSGHEEVFLLPELPDLNAEQTPSQKSSLLFCMQETYITCHYVQRLAVPFRRKYACCKRRHAALAKIATTRFPLPPIEKKQRALHENSFCLIGPCMLQTSNDRWSQRVLLVQSYFSKNYISYASSAILLSSEQN